MKARRRVELLAPAGDMECLRFALGFGADAVYLAARQFGMRASAANFTDDELCQAVRLAHDGGKKAYLTLNTLPTNQELRAMPAALRAAQKAGVDALIVADWGVLRMAGQYAPGVELHVSTQAGITNYAAANTAWQLGAKRVVLARELSLEDIREIRRLTPAGLELEVFVHGAMCMSISGRCLLSHYLAGRDANRGQCAQPCRWKYALMEEKRPGQYFEVGEDAGGSYILNANDLCAAPFLDKVIEAGATSLKIEGRAKSFYYVASVTAAYRSALDAALAAPASGYVLPAFARRELERASHRAYGSGFFFGPEAAVQNTADGGYVRRWQVVGVVYAQQGSRVFCVQRGKLSGGGAVEALVPPGRTVSFTARGLQDKDGAAIPATPHTKMIYSLLVPEGEAFPEGTILRVSLDDTDDE